ncbi:hypothetical protein E2C00_21300 [Streptomyces sp. WAC05374]|uniref:protein phosphatase 2C domain-containing protein n=1 Tax=Streptomyces sp. WAC05374 TaxID=2487420 RepID=UPI000F870650|nr:protein phosphatase 2C domain-containing protein [Streptomyces sp. WAC05374]RST13376.1 hypothetical protein EF905_20445 [Streptomyces sp. WAC05374]TDF43024.1 hypothetical protein E2B92_21520 [Streptomyces sp. WAC05374]TDF46616.1 hypothetical protein E2C02_31645 [Streptomyces sp. WAC05374]TDF53635.1 hypothetical protein E2C00_21300 [Streptomyces sp. WAC05374]
MRSEISSVPGTDERPNEDWASVAVPASGQGGTLVVLDGVTPPVDDDGCVHSVPWYTARLGGALTELSGSRPDLTVAGILAEAIRRTADAHRDSCDLSHVRTPQATVVLARWDAVSVEYLVLADSVLLLRSPEGAVRAVVDDRLDRLPPGSLASHAVTDTTVRNKEGGFFTAAADPSVAARAVTGRVPRSAVRELVAMTDGATRWTEVFKRGDWADCFAVVDEEGARGLIARVRELEASSSFAYRWKRHDDATVVHVEL